MNLNFKKKKAHELVNIVYNILYILIHSSSYRYYIFIIILLDYCFKISFYSLF